VNWKFWAKDPEMELEITDVPTSTLFRWFLYDTRVSTPNKFAEAAGFVPISDEGEEMERRESDVRLLNVIPYMDFIELMANITGEVLAETFAGVLRKYGLVESDLSIEDEKELMCELYTQISASALIPSFSAALQLGIIVNPSSFVSGEINE
jgi:hypothetical protein